MTIIENFPSSLLPYLVGTIPVIAYLLRLTIDNWGATELEKIRMSNLKKFQIFFTKHAALFLFFLAISYLIVTSSNEFTGKDKANTVYVIVIICTIIFSASMFLFEKFLTFIGNVLIFQYDYYIVDQEGNLKFRIIKPSSDNTLLVEDNGIEEFIDAKEKLRYKRILRENKALLNFYNSKWILYLIVSLVVIDIGLLVGLILASSWIRFVFYVIFLFISLISLIIFLNYILNKKISRSN